MMSCQYMAAVAINGLSKPGVLTMQVLVVNFMIFGFGGISCLSWDHSLVTTQILRRHGWW